MAAPVADDQEKRIAEKGQQRGHVKRADRDRNGTDKQQQEERARECERDTLRKTTEKNKAKDEEERGAGKLIHYISLCSTSSSSFSLTEDEEEDDDPDKVKKRKQYQDEEIDRFFNLIPTPSAKSPVVK